MLLLLVADGGVVVVFTPVADEVFLMRSSVLQLYCVVVVLL